MKTKELTKLQIIEIRRELEDRVMELVDRYEEKNGVSVNYNFTVEGVKQFDKTIKKR
jgi:hypothetical protein